MPLTLIAKETIHIERGERILQLCDSTGPVVELIKLMSLIRLIAVQAVFRFKRRSIIFLFW